MLSFLSSLPLMTEVDIVESSSNSSEELWLLLKAFPSVDELTLQFQQELDDVELQQLAEYAPHLQILKLDYCQDVTPMGLLALCLRLPVLRYIHCRGCDELTDVGVQRCTELLRSSGSLVEIETEVEVEPCCADEVVDGDAGNDAVDDENADLFGSDSSDWKGRMRRSSLND